ncbi:MAG TPA: peptidoglycan-binding domain-containing protein [Candidatus Binatia bacterium]
MNVKRLNRADLGKRSVGATLATIVAVLLAGCSGTTPTLGGGGTVATGGAGGATAENASSQLEKCNEPLGTMAVVEDQNAPWYRTLTQYRLGSTVPVLRLMIQQSNCFVIVERGQAMNNMMQERVLQNSGEMRSGSSFQKGQMVAADYTMSPSIAFSQKGTSGVGGGLGGFGFGAFGAAAGALAGGLKSNEASTTLLMVDNRSGVQLAAAVGSAQNYDYNVLGAGFGSGWGGGGGGSLGGYSNTPEGKILIASFMDSYNQIVKATRNYKAQEVKGGLGTGGGLGVQGGQTPASTPAAAPAHPMSLAEAQRRLAELGFDPGPADGAMGQRTASAFRAFQRARGLDVTGRLDAATAAQLAK